MTVVSIKWLSDSHDCDTCGWSSADGAYVEFDGLEVLNLVPSAGCFGGDHWDEQTVYEMIFEKLGHKLEVGYE